MRITPFSLVYHTLLKQKPALFTHHSKSIRAFILLPLFLLIPLFTSSCKNSSEAQTYDSNDSVTITYWCDSNPVSIELAKKLIVDWSKIHPDIIVKLEPIPASLSSEEALLAAIAAGTTPDISENIWSGAITTYTRAGALKRLNDFPDFMKYADNRLSQLAMDDLRMINGCFIPRRLKSENRTVHQHGDSHVEGINRDKEDYYALPYRTNPIMILYNETMFREAGIKTPLRTYSDYISAAAKLTCDTDGDGRIDRWMGNTSTQPVWWHRMFDFYCFFIVASGGQTLMDGDEINFDSPAAVQAMGLFNEMYRKGYYPKTNFPSDPFLAGKIATLITGPWHLAYLKKYAPEGLEYNLMPLPVPDDYEGPVHSFTSTHCLGIFSNSKHPEWVWEFVKFLTSPENDLALLEHSNQLPMRKTLLADEHFTIFFQENPLMARFAEVLPHCPGMDKNENFKEILDAISQEFEACAIYNTKTPEDAIHDAAARARVIIDWNRS